MVTYKDKHYSRREENWPFFLKLHLQWRCEFLSERWNPLSGDREYAELGSREKVEILHRLCNWRLELDDIGDLLRVRVGGEEGGGEAPCVSVSSHSSGTYPWPPSCRFPISDSLSRIIDWKIT